MHNEKPITITFRTAKQLSGLGFTKLWALAKEKRLETIHVGRRTLIIYSSFERLLLPEQK